VLEVVETAGAPRIETMSPEREEIGVALRRFLGSGA
jgi:hypothetical protein